MFQNQAVTLVSGNIKRPTAASTLAVPTVNQKSAQYRAPSHFKQRTTTRRRTLGTVSVMTGGTLTYGSSRVPAAPTNFLIRARAPVVSPIGPAFPPASGGPTPWGGNPPGWTGPISPAWGGGSSYGGGGGYQSYQNPNNPTSGNNLALLTQQYYSNPSSLTATQWAQLQAAGVIPGTVPYSNASLVNPGGNSTGAIDPATGIPYATELATAQASAAAPAVSGSSTIIGTDPTTGATTIFGVDWYWIAGGLALVYVFTGKRR